MSKKDYQEKIPQVFFSNLKAKDRKLFLTLFLKYYPKALFEISKIKQRCGSAQWRH